MENEGYAQAYGKAFARFYNERLSFFAVGIAPKLLQFFSEDEQMASQPKTLLDVACGTGQLASEFLKAGYRVLGIDLSPHMIDRAKENNRASVDSGEAMFEVADASSFTVEEPVSFAVSTFDALNHLPDANALRGCFVSVFRALSSPGLFVFDLNTARGLSRWNGISVMEDESVTSINRGIYAAGADRAYTSFTGFARRPDGAYEKFQEVAFNTVFKMAEVLRMLEGTGFNHVYAADASDLRAPVDEPENLGRVHFVCTKTWR